MTSDEALRRIKRCFEAGSYFLHPQAESRMAQRHVDRSDIRHAIANAIGIEPHVRARAATTSTSWGITGPDIEGSLLAVGIELTVDALGDHSLILTVF